MAEWTAKRFWTRAKVVDTASGAEIRLDERPVRTPAGAALVLPTRALAEGVAAEWDAQREGVDPRTMPLTRSANSALDKVAPQRAEVEAMLAEYGTTDLLCYRAVSPEALVAREAEAWDPLLDWAETRFDARLAVTSGVLPVAQPPDAVERLARPMREMNPFELAGFHDLVALSGSLVIALAASEAQLSAAALWDLSRLDETWQAEQWGADDEAEAAAKVKRQAFLDAERVLKLARAPN